MTQASLIFVRVRLRVLSATYKNFPVDSKIMLINNTMGTEVSGVGMTTKRPQVKSNSSFRSMRSRAAIII
jgi:hypothetical protein